ncbi:uncharacterized protein LOC131239145 [Magnolia sinica]|uniref:uncharacterized protein LOC131239145 n=1 Tax=Magnolia sinica TaxID=86752 RepID=UPI002658B0CA|nr:uncharacterized protein LOC131239145 [Magnolia sinica]
MRRKRKPFQSQSEDSYPFQTRSKRLRHHHCQGLVANSSARSAHDSIASNSKRNVPIMRRKRNVISQKLNLLKRNLKPIPFVPAKTLDFPKYEFLFRCLGLWDFAHLDLDPDIRLDLLTVLIANYNPGARSIFVNGVKIRIGPAEMAQAMRIPAKKKRSIDKTDFPDFDEESLSVLSDFLSNYVLLHEDAWIMPDEVLKSIRAIKEGQPQMVNWAVLIWFMVEKELSRGKELEYCYYASHLQCLMKCQKPELFAGDPVEEVFVQEDDKNKGLMSKEDFQGQDLEQNAVMLKDVGKQAREECISDFQQCKEVRGHQLQYCDLDGTVSSEFQHVVKDEVDERHGLALNLGMLSLGGDLIQDTKTGNASNGMPVGLLGPPDQLLSMKASMQKVAVINPGRPAMFGNAYNHEIDGKHDRDDVQHLRHEDCQVMMRNHVVSRDHMPNCFDLFMDQADSLMYKARMMYAKKEQECMRVQSSMEFLTRELQQREKYIYTLHSTMREEQNAKEMVIYRLEHELCVMTQLLNSYKKALKETRHEFAEYRERFQLPAEPLYKDAGPGGLVLSTKDLEKLCLETEEKERSMLSLWKVKIKDPIQYWFNLSE